MEAQFSHKAKATLYEIRPLLLLDFSARDEQQKTRSAAAATAERVTGALADLILSTSCSWNTLTCKQHRYHNGPLTLKHHLVEGAMFVNKKCIKWPV